MIKIIQSPTKLQDIIKEVSDYPGLFKGVVDVQQGILALGGMLHADAEALLLTHGSKQENLWGFNILEERSFNERLEYISMINIRPRQKNFSMEVSDNALRDRMKTIIDRLIV